MMTVFDRILSNESFADVTLVCGETEIEIASSIKEFNQSNYFNYFFFYLVIQVNKIKMLFFIKHYIPDFVKKPMA